MALTNEQYELVARHFEKIRDNNRHEMNRRTEEAYAAIPALENLKSQTAALAMAKLRARLEGNGSEPTTSIMDISNQKRNLLVAAGYPADYLDPIYTCPDCKDTGYLTEKNAENGSKIKCHCFLQKEIEFLYENSNMDTSLLNSNFSNLTYDYREGEDLEHLKGAVRVGFDFVNHFSDVYSNLLLFGTVGTGKSFLSGCIANALIQKGYSVVYFSAIGLFDMLSRYYFGQKGKEMLYNFCKNLYNYDLVIIDDLGTEITNTFVSSQLFDLINERHMGRKSTIISTNLNLDELRDRYSDRTFSRLTSTYQICKLTGPDYRLIQKGIHQFNY